MNTDTLLNLTIIGLFAGSVSSDARPPISRYEQELGLKIETVHGIRKLVSDHAFIVCRHDNTYQIMAPGKIYVDFDAVANMSAKERVNMIKAASHIILDDFEKIATMTEGGRTLVERSGTVQFSSENSIILNSGGAQRLFNIYGVAVKPVIGIEGCYADKAETATPEEFNRFYDQKAFQFLPGLKSEYPGFWSARVSAPA